MKKYLSLGDIVFLVAFFALIVCVAIPSLKEGHQNVQKASFAKK
jgi:hypothetical protein